jgi:hypothetical protein
MYVCIGVDMLFFMAYLLEVVVFNAITKQYFCLLFETPSTCE